MLSLKDRLFIFDFDGTVVDSEPNYITSGERYLDSLGIHLTMEERMRRFIGIGAAAMYSTLKDEYNLTKSVETMATESEELYLEYARIDTPVHEEVVLLARAVKALGAQIVIASGTSATVINELLTRLGLENLFDGVYSASMVARGKPAPDLFLFVAERHGVDSSRCVVLEDSEPGVRAAFAADMPCIALPMEERFAEPIFQSANLAFAGGHNFSHKAVLAAIEKNLL